MLHATSLKLDLGRKKKYWDENNYFKKHKFYQQSNSGD